MKILIQNGRIIDPDSQTDQIASLAIAAGRIVSIGTVANDFHPNKTIDATGLVVVPGLVDLCARLREPGHEHEGMLASEMAAAVAGGVTSLVCPPDTDPVLDEPGLVEMLKHRAEKLHQSRLFPIGALTRGLNGEILTEMAELTQAGCVGFGQADRPLIDTLVLQRALQYAATYGYTVWLRPQDAYLGKGVAASGSIATRLGLSGIPVAAETIAMHTIFALMRSTGARVHLCRISSASGVELIRQAKSEGLPLSCDVSINSLHLTDHDIGYFDSRARLSPPLRQQADRQALSQALADGTIDNLVSDHNPIVGDEKSLPFAQAEPGATGIELLLSLACKWAQSSQTGLMRAIDIVTRQPAQILQKSVGSVGDSLGKLSHGGMADICIFDPNASWKLEPHTLRSQGRHSPFDFDLSGMQMPARVKATLVGGQIAYWAD
jgi:dihydroorotase